MRTRYCRPFLCVAIFLAIALQITANAADTSATVIETPSNSIAIFWGITGTLALFGAFGGILAALSAVTLEQIWEEGVKSFGNSKRLWACILISSLQGIGGALVFGGLAAFDGKLTLSDYFTQKYMVYAFLSIATGFAGHKFLLVVSQKLTKDVEETIGKKTEKMRKQLEEQAEKHGKLIEAVTTLTAALREPDEPAGHFQSVAQEAMKKAEAATQLFPTDRQLGILTGRLLRRLEGYDAAISILSQFISGFKREGKANSADFAALLYNRACYKNRKAEEAQIRGEADVEKIRSEAWEDLKNSCALDLTNKEEAQNDPDLQTLPNGSTRTWINLL